MEENLPEKCVKIVLLGDSSVGKTSLATRFCHEEFGRQYYPTPGVDFFLKRTTIQGNRLVRAVMWDLDGQSLEGSMFQNYLYGTQAILLIFDITNATSFTRLTEWWKAASRCIFGKPPLIALIANKCDMEHQRAVGLEKQMKFVNDHGIQSTHTVSARTGENVMLAFQRILAELLGVRLSRAEQEEPQGVVKAEVMLAFQRILAELLGLRLSRAEQEEPQGVVKAEVMLAFQRILAELLGLRLSRAEQEEPQGVVKAEVMLAFQRILAELLGLRLSRAEQEEQQGVVKAEIVAANHNQAYSGMPTTHSTICVLQ